LYEYANSIRDILDHISGLDRRYRNRHNTRQRHDVRYGIQTLPNPIPNPITNPIPNPITNPIPHPITNPILNPIPNPIPNTNANANPVINNNLFSMFDEFYNTVAVRPSREVLERETRRVPFSEIVNPLNISCPISLERFESTTEVMELLPCHHLFSPPHILSWFERNVRCPVCRYDIRTGTTPATTNESIREETTTQTEPVFRDNLSNDMQYLSQLTDQLMQQLFPVNGATNTYTRYMEGTFSLDPSSNNVFNMDPSANILFYSRTFT
jgi:hypothetical protein